MSLLGTWAFADSLPPAPDAAGGPVVPGALTSVTLQIAPGQDLGLGPATRPEGCPALRGTYTGYRSTAPAAAYTGPVLVDRFEQDSVFLFLLTPPGVHGAVADVAVYAARLVGPRQFLGRVSDAQFATYSEVSTLTRAP